jgi:hypothetical protein
MKNVRPYHKYARTSRNAIYSTWARLKINAQLFEKKYGRPLTICERWKDFKSFVDDMGVPPKGKVLNRRKFFEGYSPENCYWTSRSEAVLCHRPEYKDYMVGKTLGSWDVFSYLHSEKGSRYYVCRCTRCKVEKRVTGQRLRKALQSVRCYSCIPYRKDRRA